MRNTWNILQVNLGHQKRASFTQWRETADDDAATKNQRKMAEFVRGETAASTTNEVIQNICDRVLQGMLGWPRSRLGFGDIMEQLRKKSRVVSANKIE